MNIKFKFLLFLILLLFPAQLVQAQQERTEIDKIVAVVNNELITRSELDRVLGTIAAEYKTIYFDPEQLREKLEEVEANLINQMIEEKLILGAAKEVNIQADEQVVEKRIEQIKQGFLNEENFELALEEQGLTLRDLQERFRNQEIMKKAVDYFVKFKITIDPGEIEQYYQTHQAQLMEPERVQLRSILIRVDDSQQDAAARRQAQMVLQRLRKGADFAELARSYSQAANATEGGDLGLVARGQFIEQIDSAIFALQPGEFTDLLETPQGYRIFKVEQKLAQRKLEFTEAQDLIQNMLYEEKFTAAFKQWLADLKAKAYISIKE